MIWKCCMDEKNVFWIEIGFHHAFGFNLKFADSSYIDFRQTGKSEKKNWD